MSINSTTVFLSAGIGMWYSNGVMRLKGSLIEHGWPYDIQIWRDEWPDNKWPRDPVYNIKPAAFEHAIRQGYKTIIWGDASITARSKMEPFVDQINRHGYWLGQSGYNCAEVCGDRMLEYFGATRDWAEKVPDCATGIFGVNMDNPLAREFIHRWIMAARDGAFVGSRHHAGQSKDPRFKFGRQDQAAASIIAGQLGVKLNEFREHCGFAWDHYPATFHCEGM